MASQLLGNLVIAVYPSPIEDAVLPQDMDRQHVSKDLLYRLEMPVSRSGWPNHRHTHFFRFRGSLKMAIFSIISLPHFLFERRFLVSSGYAFQELEHSGLCVQTQLADVRG